MFKSGKKKGVLTSNLLSKPEAEVRYYNVVGDKLLGDMNVDGHKITNLANPTDDTDVVNKNYVDILNNSCFKKNEDLNLNNKKLQHARIDYLIKDKDIHIITNTLLSGWMTKTEELIGENRLLFDSSMVKKEHVDDFKNDMIDKMKDVIMKGTISKDITKGKGENEIIINGKKIFVKIERI